MRVVAGARHACAQLDGGDVYCWGDGRDGQRGALHVDASLSPARLAEADGATAMGAADARTCWSDARGEVRCVGRDEDAAPLLTVDGQVRELAVDARHLCALHGAGAVTCAGSGRSFESGRLSGEPVVTAGATSVAVGRARSCAIVAGEVRCWGADWADGTPSFEPRAVPGTDGATAVGVGDGVACALRRGEALCWAQGSTPTAVPGVSGVDRLHVRHQRGCAWDSADDQGTVSCWTLPTGASTGLRATTRSSRIESLATGDGFVCEARSTGAVVCDGRGESGQLGRPLDAAAAYGVLEGPVLALAEGAACASTADGEVLCTGTLADGDEAAAFSIGGRPADLAVGADAACALTTGGTVCWSATTAPRAIDALRDASSVALGARACAALDGAVMCAPSSDPSAHMEPVRGLEAVDDVAVGARHACAASAGEVWCWAHDAGDAIWTNVPTQVAEADATRGLCAGDDFACALGQDRGVRCWGPALTLEAPDLGARGLACGTRHACAQRDDEVVCWGDGSLGQLGRPLARSGAPVIAARGAGTVVAGGDAACLVASDGRSACWGALPHFETAASPVLGLP